MLNTLNNDINKTAKSICSVYPEEVKAGGPFHTKEDIYENYIKHYLLNPKNVLAWHKMFMEYIDRPDAVLWVRRFENGGNKTTVRTNGRGCYSECEDGFKYVFVSNYDAQKIFMMISSGVIPDIDEFAELITKGEFPMHYSSDAKCEESSILRYNQIKVSRELVELNKQGWYFAHIAWVNGRFLRTVVRIVNITIELSAFPKLHKIIDNYNLINRFLTYTLRFLTLTFRFITSYKKDAKTVKIHRFELKLTKKAKIGFKATKIG